MQGNSGWKAVDKDRFYIGTTVPNLKKYICKKKTKNFQIGTGVPVQVMQKGAEVNMYRYTTNLYRYMREVFFGSLGF